MFTKLGGKPECKVTSGIFEPGVIAAKAAWPPKLLAEAVEAVNAAKMEKSFIAI
jgi:hypothetical protein